MRLCAALTAAFILLFVSAASAARDRTPPTVSWVQPTSGATLSGAYTETSPETDCYANASDNRGISKVEFYVDGVRTNTELNAPYACELDTRNYSDGAHTLMAKAYDTANNTASASVSVMFQNGMPPPPPSPQCSDGADNDGDGKVDFPNDPGCSSATDDDETDSPSSGCIQTVSSVSAAQSAVAAASGGNVICLADGTYGGMSLSNSTAGSRVTLQAEHALAAHVNGTITLGRRVAIDGLDVTSSGNCVTVPTGASVIDYGVLNSDLHACGGDGINWVKPALDNSNATSGGEVRGNKIHDLTSTGFNNAMKVRTNNLVVADNEMYHGPNDAAYMWGDGLRFVHNYIHDYSNPYGHHNDAFQTWGSDGGDAWRPVTNLLIDRNIIRNVTGSNAHGVMVEGPGNASWTIRNNLWQNIGSFGMILGCCDSSSGIQGVNVYNNTIRDVPSGVSFEGNTVGKVANNIFSNVSSEAIFTRTSQGASMTHDYNLYYSTPAPTETHRVVANPLFLSATDSHLQAGSPAIDAGDNGALVPVRAEDLDGNPTVRTVDIGAYEAP